MTFWEHLDELRGTLIRVLIVVLVASVATFCCKDLLFSVIIAPKSDDFITYRLVRQMVHEIPDFQVNLVNIELEQQFVIHFKMALWAAVMVVMPYIIYELFRFVSPGLYRNEKRYSLLAVVSGYLLFLMGMLLGYFVIFPLTFRFLGTYQVSEEVTNVISLSSYISAFQMLLLVMGVVFELPVLCWLLAELGLLEPQFMRKYRRHAIVLIVLLAAIITPTGDIFTLSVVSLPILGLYELSIAVVARTAARRKKTMEKQ